MAGRVREHAWETTPLGPAEAWPQSLKAIVDMLLSSGFAMVAMWGRDLIQIYNDAYAGLIGPKHPDALGRAARESWAEFWDLSGPVIQQVLDGETRTFVDVPQAIAKNEVRENRWFTNCYSPLRDEKGVIAGVLVTLLETTERVRSEAALRENESRLRLALEVAELGAWTWNLETGTGDLDPRAAQIVGLPPGPV